MLTLPNTLVSYGDNCLAMQKGDLGKTIVCDLALPVDDTGGKTIRNLLFCGIGSTSQNGRLSGSITVTGGSTLKANEIFRIQEMDSVTIGPSVTAVRSNGLAWNFNCMRIWIQGYLTAIEKSAVRDNYMCEKLDYHFRGETIPEAAFWANISLRKIHIPEGVKYLGENCVGCLRYLEILLLPASLEAVEGGVVHLGQYDGQWTENGTCVFVSAPASDNWDSYWKSYFPTSVRFHVGDGSYAVDGMV